MLNRAWAHFLGTAASPPPVLTAVSPDIGSPAGGGSLRTIAGSNFTGATGVTFGGSAASSVTVINDTTITCFAPAHAAGQVSVIVTTSAGSNAANTAYEYWYPPTETVAAFYEGPNYDAGTNTFTATVGTDVSGIGGPPYPAASSGCPDFERTTDFTLGNAVTLSTFAGSGDHLLFAVFDAESITTTANNASVWQNETMLCDASQFIGLLLRKNGSDFEAIMYEWDSAVRVAVQTITSLVNGSGAGRLILQGKKESGTLYVRAIGSSGTGSWTTGDACGATGLTTAALRIGGTSANTPDGILRAVGSKASAVWSNFAAEKFERWARAEH